MEPSLLIEIIIALLHIGLSDAELQVADHILRIHNSAAFLIAKFSSWQLFQRSPNCNDKKKKKVSCNWACSLLLKQAKFCINTWKVWARTDAHEKRLSLTARRSSIINCHRALKEVVKTITVIRINPLTDFPSIFFFFLFHLSSFVFQQLHLI